MPHRGEHVNESQVAGYLDRTLDETQRDRVEGHLADCGECRREVLAASHLLRSHSVKRLWYVGPPVLVGSVLIAMLLTNPRAATEAMEPLIGHGGRGAQLEATSPEDGALVDIRDVVLTWSSDLPATSFDVTIVDSQDRAAWEVSVSEPRVVVPAGRLKAGRTYAWRITARFEDGESAQTESRTFVVRH